MAFRLAMITVAAIQSMIGADVAANGAHVRAAMRRAAAAGARLVHFPECALSGYAGAEVRDWAAVDWVGLRRERGRVAALARELGVWVVVGANHSRRVPLWPYNSLYVIGDGGVVVGRYDKRLCSNAELTYWYSAGSAPVVFDVDGVRFGCALCIEVVFPHLFAEYERLGVDCLLLSSYSFDPIHGVMAQAHAATNCTWVSLATPVVCSASLPTRMFGPDGWPVATCAGLVPGMVLQTIDAEADRYRVALRHARPWRARARAGEVPGGDPAR